MRGHRRQFSFSRGEVSPLVWGRADMPFLTASLATCRNFIPDHRGTLHRRPGTKHVTKTKGNQRACLYPFISDRNTAFMIEATPGCFRFIRDCALVTCDDPADPDFGTVQELTVPYSAEHICDLEYAQDCNALYLVHEAYPPAKITLGADGKFEYEPLALAGPFLPINQDQNCKLCLKAGGTAANPVAFIDVGTDPYAIGDILDITVGGTTYTAVVTATPGDGTQTIDFIPASPRPPAGTWVITDVNSSGAPSRTLPGYIEGANLLAVGCAPFGPDDEGRLVRILSSQIVSGEVVPMWVTVSITDYLSPTQVVTNHTGAATECEDVWQFAAFWEEGTPGDPDYTPHYPETVWLHQNRLWLANTVDGNTQVWGSKTGSFSNFTPSEVDGQVLATNAVYATIAGGQCDDIRWMQPMGRNLLIGAQGGLHSLLGFGVNGAIQPNNFGISMNTNIGAADRTPVRVGNAVVFIDRARQKLYQALPGGQYDGIGLEDLTLFADHIGAEQFDKLAWQQSPFTLVWAVTDAGRLRSLTLQNQQTVRGWASHELGGTLIENGCTRDPWINDVGVIPADVEAQDQLYLTVKRTVNGEDSWTVEALTPFFEAFDGVIGTPYDAWFLDGAIAATPTILTQSNVLTNSPTSLQITDLACDVGDQVLIDDGQTWFGGTIQGTSNVFGIGAGEVDILPALPNAFGVAVLGQDYLVDPETCEHTSTQAPCFFEDGGAQDVRQPLFRPFCGSTALRLLKSVEDLSGLECFEGEKIALFGDGCLQGEFPVSNGTLTAPNPVAHWLVGYPYESRGELLPFRVELGATDGAGDPTRIKGFGAYVHCGRDLEIGSFRAFTPMGGPAVSGQTSSGVSYDFEPVRLDDDAPLIAGPPPLLSGWFDHTMPAAETGANAGPQAAFRVRTPMPLILRNTEVTLIIQGGR